MLGQFGLLLMLKLSVWCFGVWHRAHGAPVGEEEQIGRSFIPVRQHKLSCWYLVEIESFEPSPFVEQSHSADSKSISYQQEQMKYFAALKQSEILR